MNLRNLPVLLVTLLLSWGTLIVPISAGQAPPDIASTLQTQVDFFQILVHDQVSAIDDVDDEDDDPSDTGELSVFTTPGPDNDGDGRSDYYYTRVEERVSDEGKRQIGCWYTQSDFVWDGPTASGEGNDYNVTEQDTGGFPVATASSKPKITMMLYNPTFNSTSEAANNHGVRCPDETTHIIQPTKITGHYLVYLNPAGLDAPPESPNRISLYNNLDVETLRLEAYTKPVGSINSGPHIVARAYAIGQVNDRVSTLGITVDPFPLWLDFTNLHVVSGQPAPNLLVQRHDFDDDGDSDLDELNGGPSNPLNATSTRSDRDGDGIPNGSDVYPDDPNRFRDFDHTVTVTSPVSGTLSGPVTITWTVTSSPTNVPIEEFDLTLYKKGSNPAVFRGVSECQNLPATARTCTFDSYAALLSGAIPDDDYQVEVRATDEGSPELTGHFRASPAESFRLLNAPAPTAAVQSVVDENGNVEQTNFIAGNGVVTFTLTPGRGGLGSVLTYKIEFRQCPTDTPIGPIVATFNDQPGTAGSNSFTFDSKTFGPGRVNCDPGDTSTAPGVGPNDGRFRVFITPTETQDGFPKIGAATVRDFFAFNNRLPLLVGERAIQMDAGNETTLNAGGDLNNGTKVRVSVLVQDDDAGCHPTGQPTSVQVEVTQGGTVVRSAQMARSSLGSFSQGATYSLTNKCGAANRINVFYQREAATPATSGVEFESLLSDLPFGDYSYSISIVDAHGNSHDGVVGTVAPATGTFTMGPDSEGTANAFVTDTLGCQGGETQAQCLQRFAADAASNAVKTIEDARQCDVPGLGYDAKYPQTCQDQAVETITNAASGVGLPNGYPFVNCPLVNGQAQCDPNDGDQDGDLDADEAADGTDPYNPYSNSFDRDADLFANVAELFVDVAAYRIAWVNTSSPDKHECGAADPQSKCLAQVRILPSPDKHVTVYPAPGLPWLLNVTEIPSSEGVLRVTSELGCPGIGPAAVGCGFSWTVLGGLLVGPTVTNCAPGTSLADLLPCQIHLRVNLEDDERGVELDLDFTAAGESGGKFLDLQLLGGKRTESNKHNLTVQVNPFKIARDGISIYDSAYNLNNSIALGNVAVGKPEACSPTSPQPASGTGSWLRTDRTSDDRWRICGQVQGSPGTLDPTNFWHETEPHFIPVVGTFVRTNGDPVVWLDKDGDSTYDAGEELTVEAICVRADGTCPDGHVASGEIGQGGIGHLYVDQSGTGFGVGFTHTGAAPPGCNAVGQTPAGGSGHCELIGNQTLEGAVDLLVGLANGRVCAAGAPDPLNGTCDHGHEVTFTIGQGNIQHLYVDQSEAGFGVGFSYTGAAPQGCNAIDQEPAGGSGHCELAGNQTLESAADIVVGLANGRLCVAGAPAPLNGTCDHGHELTVTLDEDAGATTVHHIYVDQSGTGFGVGVSYSGAAPAGCNTVGQAPGGGSGHCELAGNQTIEHARDIALGLANGRVCLAHASNPLNKTCDHGHYATLTLDLTLGATTYRHVYVDRIAQGTANEVFVVGFSYSGTKPTGCTEVSAGHCEVARTKSQNEASALLLDSDGDGSNSNVELTSNPRSNPFYKYSKPGDAGGGFPDDWDADGFSNHVELIGVPFRSNPFQRCSTPSNPNGWSTSKPTHSCET